MDDTNQDLAALAGTVENLERNFYRLEEVVDDIYATTEDLKTEIGLITNRGRDPLRT